MDGLLRVVIVFSISGAVVGAAAVGLIWFLMGAGA